MELSNGCAAALLRFGRQSECRIDGLFPWGTGVFGKACVSGMPTYIAVG